MFYEYMNACAGGLLQPLSALHLLEKSWNDQCHCSCLSRNRARCGYQLLHRSNAQIELGGFLHSPSSKADIILLAKIFPNDEHVALIVSMLFNYSI